MYAYIYYCEVWLNSTSILMTTLVDSILALCTTSDSATSFIVFRWQRWNVNYLSNDPFDYYGHTGSVVIGDSSRGWVVGHETMKDDTFLRSTRNPWTAMSRTRTTNLQIYSSARYHRANPTPLFSIENITGCWLLCNKRICVCTMYWYRWRGHRVQL